MAPDISSKLASLRWFVRRSRDGSIEDVILRMTNAEGEVKVTKTDIEVLADVADAASWYLRCVDDVRARKSVRAFDEAESALRTQLEKLAKLP